MDVEYLKITEESNALDYFMRAAEFVRTTRSDPFSWKWSFIAIHGAIYGFAICALKGTNYERVTKPRKDGRRSLISFREAIEACQNPSKMCMTVMSRPLVLDNGQIVALGVLQHSYRNPFAHFTPGMHYFEKAGFSQVLLHCIEIARFLALETGNFTNLTNAERNLIAETASNLVAELGPRT